SLQAARELRQIGTGNGANQHEMRLILGQTGIALGVLEIGENVRARGERANASREADDPGPAPIQLKYFADAGHAQLLFIKLIENDSVGGAKVLQPASHKVPWAADTRIGIEPDDLHRF